MISVILFYFLKFLGKESFFSFSFCSWNEVLPTSILFSFFLSRRCIWYTHRQTQICMHLNTRSIIFRLSRKDIYMFIVMRYVSLSQSLKFFPVFESLFRHMSHQILQGKMEGSVILGNVLNVPFHEALFLNKCRNWRLQTTMLLTNLRGNRY